MDLNTGRLLWKETYPNPPSYPPLNQSIHCDVLVIGGGEAGALVGWTLSELGLDTVVVEKDRIGNGSTAANTGLLQYMNDSLLYQMMEKHGEASAIRFYRMCQEALDRLESIAHMVPDDIEFVRRDSLYFASREQDISIIDQEYKALKTNRFPVDYLIGAEIRSMFGFEKPAALLTHHDAEVNPYRLAHALIKDGCTKHLRAYEETEVISFRPNQDPPKLTTTQAHTIDAAYVVICAGYQSQEVLPLPGAQIACTYAMATQPVSDFGSWGQRTLLWETARPYLYLRTTKDNRVLMGGMDGKAVDGMSRDGDLLKQTDALKDALVSLFPQFSQVEVAYRWASTFGSTEDGMPLIGRDPHHPHYLYALGFGGNGTVYYSIAADIVSGLIKNGRHPDESLFAPFRMRWYNSMAKQMGKALSHSRQ